MLRTVVVLRARANAHATVARMLRRKAAKKAANARTADEWERQTVEAAAATPPPQRETIRAQTEATAGHVRRAAAVQNAASVLQNRRAAEARDVAEAAEARLQQQPQEPQEPSLEGRQQPQGRQL